MGKIIEFAGIPGSGKTTISNMLLKENKNYFDEQKFYHDSVGIKNVFPVVLHIIKPIHLKLKMHSLKLLTFTKWKNKTRMFRSLIKLNRLDMILLKKKDNYIISEGIIQNILEILNNCPTENQQKIAVKLLNELIKLHSNMKFIYLISNVNESYDNVKKRDAIPNTIDKLNDEKLMKTLEDYKLSENIILKNIKKNKTFILVETNQSNEIIKSKIKIFLKDYI